MNHYQPEVAQPKWAQVYSTCCKTITTLMGNHTSLQNLRKDSYELESSIGACPKLKQDISTSEEEDKSFEIIGNELEESIYGADYSPDYEVKLGELKVITNYIN